MSFFGTSQLVEQGRQLEADVRTFAEGLAQASQTAIEATNPSLIGSELGDEWPLTSEFIIRHHLTEMVAPSVRDIGGAVLADTIPVYPGSFMQNKIRNDALIEVYGPEGSRHEFARDILGWVNRLHDTGWSLLARLCVSEPHRVVLDVYEDNNATRDYFQKMTAPGRLTPEEIAEGAESYAWLGERAVTDDPAFAFEVLQALKRREP